MDSQNTSLCNKTNSEQMEEEVNTTNQIATNLRNKTEICQQERMRPAKGK